MIFELDDREVSEDDFERARANSFAGHQSWRAGFSDAELRRQELFSERMLRFALISALTIAVLSGVATVVLNFYR